ncbi:MAG TPA: hypothetical protein DDZ88_14825 [Verrucomicrobiales bacterium]|nr:hypothetical protein [Verrucomicrobiales bacterium]
MEREAAAVGVWERAKFTAALVQAAQERIAREHGGLKQHQLAIKARWDRVKAGEASADQVLRDEAEDTCANFARVTAELHVFAPVAFPIDFVVAVEPNTVEVRAAIEAELFDAMTRDAAPGGIIHFSRMSEAISLAQGEFRHRLELPDRDVEAPPGAMPMLGEVSFVA